MSKRSLKTSKGRRGVTLLIAVVISFLLLIIGTTIAAIAFKELSFSNLIRESQKAFYVSEAGTECTRHLLVKGTVAEVEAVFPHDSEGGSPGSIICNGSSHTVSQVGSTSGDELNAVSDFMFNFGYSGEANVNIEVTRTGGGVKDYLVTSSGYNTVTPSALRVERQRESRISGLCVPNPDIALVTDYSGSVTTEGPDGTFATSQRALANDAIYAFLQTVIPSTDSLSRVAQIHYAGGILDSTSREDYVTNDAVNSSVFTNNIGGHLALLESTSSTTVGVGTNTAEALYGAYKLLVGGDSFDESEQDNINYDEQDRENSDDFVILLTDGGSKSVRNGEKLNLNGSKNTSLSSDDSYGCDNDEGFIGIGGNFTGDDDMRYWCRDGSTATTDGNPDGIAKFGDFQPSSDKSFLDVDNVFVDTTGTAGMQVMLENTEFAADQLKSAGVTVITVALDDKIDNIDGSDVGDSSSCPGYDGDYPNISGKSGSGNYEDGSCSDHMAEQIASSPGLHYHSSFEELREVLEGITFCVKPQD